MVIKITKAQQDATNELNYLTNLNNSQRQSEHDEINSAPSQELKFLMI